MLLWEWESTAHLHLCWTLGPEPAFPNTLKKGLKSEPFAQMEARMEIDSTLIKTLIYLGNSKIFGVRSNFDPKSRAKSSPHKPPPSVCSPDCRVGLQMGATMVLKSN